MMVSKKERIYYLPCNPHSVYLNITNECINNCLFCIKREGPLFFGNNLSLDVGLPEASEFLDSLADILNRNITKEIVFCGMGEPLLRYECVLGVCRSIKESISKRLSLRVDTSGLFWGNDKRLDILDYIDVLSVSLNAQNAKIYEELCLPKIDSAYEVLMNFLRAVKSEEIEKKKQSLHFPEIRLSVVDTSEEEFLPISGRKMYTPGTFPVPDFAACRKIAAEFGWPFVIKRLFRDSCDEKWNDPAIQEMCARGISIDSCKFCSFRH